jgi:membrane protease YdiL (CAAX protease family)
LTGPPAPGDPDRVADAPDDPEAVAHAVGDRESEPAVPPHGDPDGDHSQGAAEIEIDDEEPRAPGLTTFTIEGRTAPALFVVAWLGIILGAGVTFVGLMATPGLPAGILFVSGLAVLSLGMIAAAGSQAIERRTAGWRRYHGPSPLVAFLAVLPLTAFLVVVIGTPLVGFGLPATGPAAALISIVVHALVYLLVIRLVVVGTGSLTWRDLGVVRPNLEAFRDLAWGGLLAFPVLFVTGLVALLLGVFFPIPESPLPPAPDTLGLILNVVTAAIVAPIGEELFFRGFATTAWARTLGPRRAIVRGALFFALVHVLGVGAEGAAEGLGLAAFAFAVRIPVSLALGWVFVRRRTLYAPIALHAVFNAVPVLLLGVAA